MATLVDLDRAKLHLRVDEGDEDALIEGQLSAAERISMAWIRRNVYADQTALDAAVAAAPGQLTTASEAYQLALAAAMVVSDAVERTAAIEAAREAYDDAQAAVRRARRGVVLDDLFASAVLLTLGALYKDRELTEPPQVAQWLLDPMRFYG